MTVPIDKINRYLGPVILALIGTDAKRATKYISPEWVISAQRIAYKGKSKKRRIDRRDRNIDIRVKIGRPNYHERDCIKKCIMVKVPFPVRGVQLSYFRV